MDYVLQFGETAHKGYSTSVWWCLDCSDTSWIITKSEANFSASIVCEKNLHRCSPLSSFVFRYACVAYELNTLTNQLTGLTSEDSNVYTMNPLCEFHPFPLMHGI